MFFVAEHQQRAAGQFHLHHGLAHGQGGHAGLHLGDDHRVQPVVAGLPFFLIGGQHIHAGGFKGNRLGPVLVMVLQPALVAAQLLVHPLLALFEGGIDLGRGALGLDIQPGGQMHHGIAGELMRIAGKNHRRVGRTLGILVNGLTKFGFHMRRKRVADIDLFSADLVAHGCPSFRLPGVVVAAPAQVPPGFVGPGVLAPPFPHLVTAARLCQRLREGKARSGPQFMRKVSPR